MIGLEMIQNIYNGHDRRELEQNDTIPISSGALDSEIGSRLVDQHVRDQHRAGPAVPWTQFCDDCAKFAAYDFAQSWFNYLADNVVNLASSPAEFNVDEKLVALKFCRSFVGYFENEARRICRSSRLLNETSAFCSATVNAAAATSRDDQAAINQFVDGDINENDANNNNRVSLLVSDTESDGVSFENGGGDLVDENRSRFNIDDPSSSQRRNDAASNVAASVGVISNRKGFSRRRNFFQKLSLKNVRRTFFRHRNSENDMENPIHGHSSMANGDQTNQNSNDISSNNTVRLRSTTTTTNTILRRNPSGGNGNAGGPSLTKSSKKTVVEVVKDGAVNFVSGKDLDGKKWEKGRLCLIKTAGGYLLEFYSPPKASKPKSGVFCFLITEVRETTELETPDTPDSLVIKAENYMEYVVQAKDLDDMKNWISLIRHCTDFPLDGGSTEIDLNPVQLRPRLTSAPASDSLRIRHCESLPASRGANRITPQRSSGYFGGRVTVNDAADTVSVGGPAGNGAQGQGQQQQQLHRSLSTGHDVAYRVRNSTNAAIAASVNDQRMGGGSQTLDVDDGARMTGAGRTISPSLRSRANLEYRRSGDLFASFTSTLHEFPWFHGLMTRSDAAMLILQAGRDGHGLFLVRQSETRLGEYVLTFNCYGRAKHIRLNIGSDGQAQVLNLLFPTIFEVLEFYRQNEIPFENGGGAGAGTNFLAAEQQQMGISICGSLGHYVIAWPPHNRSRRSRQDPCDPRDYMSHDGSVRIRTRSLERMAVQMSRNAAAAQLAAAGGNDAAVAAGLAPHRPENNYQLV